MAGSRRTATTVKFALALALVALATEAAFAQSSKPSPAAPTKPRGAPHPTPKKPPPGPETGSPPAPTAAATSASPAGAAPPLATIPSDAGVVEAKTLDGGTRVFKFSELEIEGRLKSPQLVYFLRRVRAEFAAGDLGHRSFLREMSETRKESSF
jgi:hypothetical protein